jgi:hypothetical protein
MIQYITPKLRTSCQTDNEITPIILEPRNELERALAFLGSPEGNRNFFQLLPESDLYYVVDYYPGVEATTEVWQLSFSCWTNPRGEYTPFFTALERACEGLQRLRRTGSVAVGHANGQALFVCAAEQGQQVALNPLCPGTGTFLLDATAVAAAANRASF